MPCYCESCTKEPRYTYTVEFMRLCEARYVIGLPTLERRRAYIAGVAKERGEQSAHDLGELIKREWGNK